MTIDAFIEKHSGKGCILFEDAEINKIRGLDAAIDAGYSRIGIRVNAYYGKNLQDLRSSVACQEQA